MIEEEIGHLEAIVLSQINPLNACLKRVFGNCAPTIDESSVHCISEATAEEISRESNDTAKSSIFTYKGQIYFVNERISRRKEEEKNLPGFFKDQRVKAFFALAHEGLHNACKPLENGSTVKSIASTCWEAEYDSMVNQSGEEVPADIKLEFKKINDEIKGKEIKVKVEGTEITFGTEERPVYVFGSQTNEDLIDFMATLTTIDYIKSLIKLSKRDEENALRSTFLLNFYNRQSAEAEDIKALFLSLKNFMSIDRRQKVFQAFFSGKFFEEFASKLNEEEHMYFCCYLIMGSTSEALDILQGKGIKKIK